MISDSARGSTRFARKSSSQQTACAVANVMMAIGAAPAASNGYAKSAVCLFVRLADADFPSVPRHAAEAGFRSGVDQTRSQGRWSGFGKHPWSVARADD